MAAYAGIICPVHGKKDIDFGDYANQLAETNAFWRCPVCNSDSQFDDERFEEINLQGDDPTHEFAYITLCLVPGEGCDVVTSVVDILADVDESILEIIERHMTALRVELQELQG